MSPTKNRSYPNLRFTTKKRKLTKERKELLLNQFRENVQTFRKNKVDMPLERALEIYVKNL